MDCYTTIFIFVFSTTHMFRDSFPFQLSHLEIIIVNSRSIASKSRQFVMRHLVYTKTFYFQGTNMHALQIMMIFRHLYIVIHGLNFVVVKNISCTCVFYPIEITFNNEDLLAYISCDPLLFYHFFNTSF